MTVPLDNTEIVDIVMESLPIGSQGVWLVLYDDGSVTDEIRRHRLFIEKLTYYVGYVMSGEFANQYPGRTYQDVVILMLYTTPPNEAMTQVTAVKPRAHPDNGIPVYFESLSDFIQKHGLNLPVLNARLSTKQPKRWWQVWRK